MARQLEGAVSRVIHREPRSGEFISYVARPTDQVDQVPVPLIVVNVEFHAGMFWVLAFVFHERILHGGG
jgi:hypothetical protein